MGSGQGRGRMNAKQHCSKYILMFFNIIFFLLGAVSLGIGIWILLDKNSFMNLAKFGMSFDKANVTADLKDVADNYVNSPSLIQTGAYIMIGVGALNFVVGFCGCCGAFKESKCLLFIYCFLLAIVFIVEIAGTVLGIIFRQKIESILEEQLTLSLQKYYRGNPSLTVDVKQDAGATISLAWDYAQVLLGCCGVKSYTDFSKTGGSLWYKNYRKYELDDTTYTDNQVLIPETCCKFPSKSRDFVSKADWKNIQKYMTNTECPIVTSNSTEPVDFNNIGCIDKLKEEVGKYSLILICIAAGIAVIELIGLVLACCVIRGINADSTKYSGPQG